MEEKFGVAAFRSRQQVMLLHRALRRVGIPAQVITTPRSIAVGCGLSVRFELKDAQDVFDVCRMTRPGNLIGFYQAWRTPAGTEVKPMGMQLGYNG